jgi:hypothetical protein
MTGLAAIPAALAPGARVFLPGSAAEVPALTALLDLPRMRCRCI